MATDPFFKLIDRVDSTNNYAMEQAHAGLATHGMAWFAHEQTAGKGQREKTWEAAPGKNIALSVVLEPGQLKVAGQFYLSAAMALACFEFFSGYAGTATKIKWPNDIYWRDRKAGGILIENVFLGTMWKYAVVGIGININQVRFDSNLKNPVSLKQITGKEFDPLALAKELYAVLMKRAEMLDSTNFKKTIQEYNQHLYRVNEKVRLKKENMVFETMVNGVNNKGQLITKDTIERYFNFGEVEWLGESSMVNGE